MGVIRPPWVDLDWFHRCPFNYCDHFGDKQKLKTVCKICADEVARLAKYKKLGLDPYDIENVLKETADMFAQISKDLKTKAKELNIDLDNLPPQDIFEPNPNQFPIYQVLKKYNYQVGRLILRIGKLAQRHPWIVLFTMVFDVLAHSQNYILSKVARAIISRHEEENDPDLQKCSDAKTSALFIYLAVQRNALAITALAEYIKMIDSANIKLREFFLEFADLSHDISQLVKQEFFPKDDLIYEEVGCENYEITFLSLLDKPDLRVVV